MMTKVLLVAASIIMCALGDTVTIPIMENSTYSYIFEREKYARALEIRISYNPSRISNNEEGSICCTLEQRDRGTTTTWLPLTTVFCRKLQYYYESRGTFSVKFSNYKRWNSTSEHRLLFSTTYTQIAQTNINTNTNITTTKTTTITASKKINEERCVSVGVRQPLISTGEQQGIAMGILFIVCFALCLGRIFRGHVIVVGCIVSFVMLAVAKKLPTSEEVISWIDANTLFLNMSMDAFAHTMCKAGLARWVAGLVLEHAHGRPRLIGVYSWLFAYALSIFLPAMASLHFCSNVAFVAAEAININPFPIIIGQAVMINIGSCILPNDPSLYLVTKYFGIHSYETIYNILPCSILCCAAAIAVLIFYFRRDLNNKVPPLFRHKVKKAASKYIDYDDDEDESDDDDSDDSDDEDGKEEKYDHTALDSPEQSPSKSNGIELKIRRKKKRNSMNATNTSSESATSSSRKGGSKRKSSTAADSDSQPKFDRSKYAIKDINTVFSGLVCFVIFNIVSFLYDFIRLDPGIASLFFVCAHVFLSTKVFNNEIYNVVDIPSLALICIAFVFINSLNELGLSVLFCKYHNYI